MSERRIYKNVVHDDKRGNFEMDRQVHLLAMAGAAVWNKWMELNPSTLADDTPLLCEMRELYHQLVKTDIFMGGVNEGSKAP